MKKLFAIILSLGLIIAPMPAAHAAGGGGVGSYAKIVLGMANGIVGSTILMKCKMGSMQPSLIAYMAGSLVYIAAEILGGKGKAKSVEKNSESLDATKASMKEGGDYQKAAIQGQIDNEQANLDHIKKKRKWMMATKVVYGIATALALIEFWMSLSPPVGLGKPDAGACSSDPSHEGVQMGVVMAYKALNGYANGGLMGAGMALATPYIMKFLGMVKTGTKVVNMAVSALNSALGRVAVFAAATALVMVIDGGLKKEQKRSEKIIADLEKVKAQFDGADNSLAEGSSPGEASGANGGGLGAGVKDPSSRQYALRALPSGVELAKHCYSNSEGNLNYSESGCKNPIKLTRPSFDSKFNIPALTAGTNTGIDMAQAVADGDLKRADILAGNLAAMAGRIDAIKDDLMKKTNDKLIADGKKPIDVRGTLNKQLNDLNDALNKENPGSGNFTMADIDGDSASGDTASGDKPSETQIAVATPAPIEVGAGLDLSSVGNGLVDETMTDPNAAGSFASLDDSLNNYESAESDISNAKEVSIFRQVSNRYFLNYTKIFQRKEITPPLAEPAPTP